MKSHTKLIMISTIFTLIAAGCTAAKTAGKVVSLPVKGAYQAGKYTGKAAIWTGKKFVKTGETAISFTNAALNTTSQLLIVTSQLINTSGQIVSVSEQISRAELEATLEAARLSSDIISVLVDVANT